MEYRKFGHTGMMVSEVGFGAWAIGGNAKVGGLPIGWGIADDRTSVLAINAAVNAGINFFDTADFYGLGHSEELLGTALKDNRQVLIATKVGHKESDGKIELDYSKKYILEACEASLRRLQRDTIDYYQLHSARVNHLREGSCIEAMELLKQQGKIRYWGVSLNTFGPSPEANFLVDHKLGDGLQLVFNLINQGAFDIIEKANQNGYGLIARMPLQFGLLTGKFTSAAKFSSDDHRSFRLTKDIIERSLAVLQEKIWPLAANEKISKTIFALSFILSFKEISTTIPGIRTPEHVFQNTKGLKLLSENDMHYLRSLGDKDWKIIMELMKERG